MLKLATFVAAVLYGSTAFAAEGQMTVSGCTAGYQDGCLLLRTKRTTYLLYAVFPRPAVGRGVTVTGAIGSGPNFCMSGTGLRVDDWNYNRMRCAK